MNDSVIKIAKVKQEVAEAFASVAGTNKEIDPEVHTFKVDMINSDFYNLVYFGRTHTGNTVVPFAVVVVLDDNAHEYKIDVEQLYIRNDAAYFLIKSLQRPDVKIDQYLGGGTSKYHESNYLEHTNPKLATFLYCIDNCSKKVVTNLEPLTDINDLDLKLTPEQVNLGKKESKKPILKTTNVNAASNLLNALQNVLMTLPLTDRLKTTTLCPMDLDNVIYSGHNLYEVLFYDEKHIALSFEVKPDGTCKICTFDLKGLVKDTKEIALGNNVIALLIQLQMEAHDGVVPILS